MLKIIFKKFENWLMFGLWWSWKVLQVYVSAYFLLSVVLPVFLLICFLTFVLFNRSATTVICCCSSFLTKRYPTPGNEATGKPLKKSQA